MNDIDSINKFSESKKIEDSNQSTYLPNKELVTYHSLILLEVFNLEDFDKLKKGLDKFYGNLSNPKPYLKPYAPIIEEIKEELENPTDSKRYKWMLRHLPKIYNSKFNKDTSIISHDLGNYIENLNISLYHFSSFVIMKIYLKLTSGPSDKLNDIIYGEYNDEEVNTNDSELVLKVTYGYTGLKAKKVSNLRSDIKQDIIDHLTSFFKGFFLKSSKEDQSFIPSIDLFSITYPEKNEEIIQWGNENQNFLKCFGITNLNSAYKFAFYILCQENEFKYNEFLFGNHVIFVNSNSSLLTANLSEAIEYFSYNIDFSLFALKRLILIYNDIISELNYIISNEIKNLEENKINDILKSRKKLSKKIYHFKRYKIDFEQYKPMTYDLFGLIIANEGRKNKIFEILIDEIRNQINNIDNTINTLNQNANIILNLKNIEYSNNLKKWTRILSIVVVILAVIQIILNSSIIQIIFNIYNYLVNFIFPV